MYLKLSAFSLGDTRIHDLKRSKLIEYGKRRAKEGAGPPTLSIDFSFLGTLLTHAAAVHGIAVYPEEVKLARVALSRLGLVGKGVERDRRPTQDELTRLIVYFWRTWDRYPSGRLCIEITDPTQYRWNDQNLVGRWYDRKAKFAEDYLSEAIVALAGAAALAKHRRAEAEKQARIRAEQEELRQRGKARRERDLKRREYLTKKAESYEGCCRLVALQTVFGQQAKENGNDQFNRIASVLQQFIETKALQG
jgi:hypothetical protein